MASTGNTRQHSEGSRGVAGRLLCGAGPRALPHIQTRFTLSSVQDSDSTIAIAALIVAICSAAVTLRRPDVAAR